MHECDCPLLKCATLSASGCEYTSELKMQVPDFPAGTKNKSPSRREIKSGVISLIHVH